MKKIALVALNWLVLLTIAQAASFDCGKAISNAELLICRDTQLSNLDDELSKVYQKALDSSKDKHQLTKEQRLWLRDVRNACLNSACLKSVYKLRISEMLVGRQVAKAELPQSKNNEQLVPFKMEVPQVCDFSNVRLPEDSVVLAAGGYGGKQLDFQIDQSGHGATQIDVAVNYPDKPVVLMLGAYEPTIWNVGWTSNTKIVAVFANGYNRQRVAGLTSGTPLLQSGSLDHGPCLVGYFSNDRINQVEEDLSQKLFARPIASFSKVIDGKVLIGKQLLSDQTIVTSTNTPPRSFIDKNIPLAGEAGLQQALKARLLRRATEKDAAKWTKALKRKYAKMNRQPPDIAPYLINPYVVLKEFICPAGLYGGDSATFYVPIGVPPPKGNCGHSRIYDFNTMMLECTAGSACGEAMMNGSIGAGSTQQVIIMGTDH